MGITLRHITTADGAYPAVEHLLNTAFPECERRDDPAQRQNTDHEPAFVCCSIQDGDRCVGLLTYWRFDRFCYVEHFAIDPSLRCGGYGSRALRAFVAEVGMPVVLEVEMPDTEMARRRIGFYQRHGFNLWTDVPYLQPPYRKGDSPVPMMLMATDGLNPDYDYESVKSLIYHKVYNV